MSPSIEVVSWPVDEAPQEVVNAWRAQRAGNHAGRPPVLPVLGYVVAYVDGQVVLVRRYTGANDSAPAAFYGVRRDLGRMLGGEVEWTTGYLPHGPVPGDGPTVTA